MAYGLLFLEEFLFFRRLHDPCIFTGQALVQFTLPVPFCFEGFALAQKRTGHRVLRLEDGAAVFIRLNRCFIGTQAAGKIDDLHLVHAYRSKIGRAHV